MAPVGEHGIYETQFSWNAEVVWYEIGAFGGLVKQFTLLIKLFYYFSPNHTFIFIKGEGKYSFFILLSFLDTLYNVKVLSMFSLFSQSKWLWLFTLIKLITRQNFISSNLRIPYSPENFQPILYPNKLIFVTSVLEILGHFFTLMHVLFQGWCHGICLQCDWGSPVRNGDIYSLLLTTMCLSTSETSILHFWKNTYYFSHSKEKYPSLGVSLCLDKA